MQDSASSQAASSPASNGNGFAEKLGFKPARGTDGSTSLKVTGASADRLRAFAGRCRFAIGSMGNAVVDAALPILEAALEKAQKEEKTVPPKKS